MYGEWRTSPKEYVTLVKRYVNEIGEPDWIAPQDWMCEPEIIAKTGRTIKQHQERTIESVLYLRGKLSDVVHVIPVLQGWEIGDYHEHAAQYAKAGINLRTESTIGIGSICRRPSPGKVIQSLSGFGLNFHAFGIKGTVMRVNQQHLVSADSMAWSMSGRRLPNPGHSHKHCGNCLEYALHWRNALLA